MVHRYAALVAPVLLGIVVAATGVASPASKTLPPAKIAASPTPAPRGRSKYQQQALAAFHNSAPADQYFGRLKLSYLGINNTLRDSAISAGEKTTDLALVNKIGFAEDALADWEKKYPRDPQLARTYFLAIAAEKKIWIKTNQERAWTYMNRILAVFPTTYFGKQVKRDLGIGFTEHYYADALPCETPTPSPTPTPIPIATPVPATPAPSRHGARPTPSPTARPTPEPTATPVEEIIHTPAPAPRVMQISKGLSVQIEIPGCIPPATPTPAPTPTANATAVPTPAPPPAAATSAAPTASQAPATPHSRGDHQSGRSAR